MDSETSRWWRETGSLLYTGRYHDRPEHVWGDISKRRCEGCGHEVVSHDENGCRVRVITGPFSATQGALERSLCPHRPKDLMG